ncbi:10547_t:CDS:2, partial [Paraglomus brasilianum]
MKAIVPTYTSHGQTDTNLDATVIDREELDKKFGSLQGTDITTEENRLKNLISQAKVKPDIESIESELNKKPVIAASELKNSDYKGEIVGLVTDDAQRNSKKNDVITEITQIRENKLGKVRQLITNAQTVKDKEEATKEELESAINDLKTLANASSDS